MRDVDYGWIIRYMHTTGSSMFFLLIYLHMFRGLLYGSYQKPRELLWVLGWLTYIILVAEGFTGYVLPWGQMSFWAAQVILSLIGSIPIFGEELLTWIRGDYLISGITLNRLFAFHVVLLPLALIAVVFVHIVALHEVGSNNPEGIDIKKHLDEDGVPLDSVPFFPYDVVKDLFAIGIFLIIFCFIIFFFPDGGGYLIEYINYEEANNLKTPDHIVPAWYYTPYYAMLRAITFPIGPLTAKFLGFVVMGGAMVIIAFVPWLDKSPVKSIRYKGLFSKLALFILVLSFIVLGYLGMVTPNPLRTALAQVFTATYFLYFILMPFYTKYEKCKVVPERIKI
jgi:ubiquinol-cytochrome c reductase cytochrome b subunit